MEKFKTLTAVAAPLPAGRCHTLIDPPGTGTETSLIESECSSHAKRPAGCGRPVSWDYWSVKPWTPASSHR